MSRAQGRRKRFVEIMKSRGRSPAPPSESGTCSPCGFRRRRCRSLALIIALLVGAGDHRPGFQVLLDQESISAAWALLVDRLVRGSELALRVVRTAIERVALACFLLHQIAVFAIRALHTDEVLLHEFTIRISGAGSEFAVTTVADHQIASALRAWLVERNIGYALALIEAARGLAIRITRARHELAKAPALENHHAAAVLAILFLRCLLHVGRIEIGQVDGIFFRERAAFRILFVVRTAGVEGPVLSPLDDEG